MHDATTAAAEQYVSSCRTNQTAADGADRERTAAAHLLLQIRYLQQEIARLAGSVAETEEQVAAAFRRWAERDPLRSAEHLRAAAEADRRAARKRGEQRRWQLP